MKKASKLAMPTMPSLDDFRSTRKILVLEPSDSGETVYTYWNNNSDVFDEFNRDEILHIVREANGGFYLQIANIVERGPLQQLEEKLYEWAKDEGWLDD